MQPTATSNFKTTLEGYQSQIEAAIDQYLPATNTRPEHLHTAMRYSMEAGGKRLRPALLLAAHALQPSKTDPLPAAVAVECIHTYSLIHDDLPCMDNSPLRRGKPTCHEQFDEATALLAGDGLLTHAFHLLASHYPEYPKLTQELALAAGSEQLIGGQAEDLLAEKTPPTKDRLEFIHANKTAAMMTAPILMGCHLWGADSTALIHAKALGQSLGMAFQIIDDILDLTGTEEALGKPTNQDIQKLTYPSLYGLEQAKETAKKLTEQSLSHARALGAEHTFLLELIEQLEYRIT